MANDRTATWVQWVLGVLLTIFMGISGYSVYRVDKVATDLVVVSRELDTKIDSAKDVLRGELAVVKEFGIKELSINTKDFVTSREYGQLCRRLDNMEAKIDILIRRSK